MKMVKLGCGVVFLNPQLIYERLGMGTYIFIGLATKNWREQGIGHFNELEPRGRAQVPLEQDGSSNIHYEVKTFEFL